MTEGDIKAVAQCMVWVTSAKLRVRPFTLFRALAGAVSWAGEGKLARRPALVDRRENDHDTSRAGLRCSSGLRIDLCRCHIPTL